MTCILLEILLASSEFIFKERREGHKNTFFFGIPTTRTNVLIVKCLFLNQILVSVQKLYETNLLLR